MAAAGQAAAVVVDPIVAFIQPAEVDGPKEDVPAAGGERLQADGQRGQDVGDVHPPSVPANAAVGRDAPDFEVVGIRDRLPPRHRETIGRRVERGGPALPERLVWPHLVEGMPKRVEAALLGAEGPRRRPRGVGLAIAMHPFVAAILLG